MHGGTWQWAFRFVVGCGLFGMFFCSAAVRAEGPTGAKSIHIDVVGQDAGNVSIAYQAPSGNWEKLSAGADGARHFSVSGEKLTLQVSRPGAGSQTVGVALPDSTDITLRVHSGDKVSVSVVTPLGGKAGGPLPPANARSLTEPGPAQQGVLGRLADAAGQKPQVNPALKDEGGSGGAGRGGPANDDCANAIAVGNGSTAFDTTGATTDGPAHAACLFFGNDQVGQDIWFCYTADCDGTATFSLCTSDYDTKMAVYDGCACPVSDATLLACNDDACGVSGLRSEIMVSVTNGNQYLIRVGGFGANAGPGTLDISCVGSGGGMGGSDDCTTADPISGSGVFPFDNSMATTDGNPHAACDFFGQNNIENDVWFCWTADCDGNVVVETCGLTGVDTKLAVYDGCAVCPPTDAELLACNDDACSLQSRVTFTAVNGNSYLIRLGNFPGAAGGPGSGSLNIDCQGAPPPALCTAPLANCQQSDLSDALNSTTTIFHTADDFTVTTSGDITDICWKGGYFDGFGDCSAFVTDAFEVSYYADAGGAPGALIGGPFVQGASLTVGGPSPTGGLIVGFLPEYEFTGMHAPVPVTAGECYWIEIRNSIAGSGCSWFWSVSPDGNGRAVQDGTPPDGFTLGDVVLNDLDFCLNLELGDPATCLPPPAANDDCANADAIAGEGVFGFDNSAATTDGPAHAACDFFGQTGIDNDVWFCWTADCDGVVTVSTCSQTSVDTKIAVYDGCNCMNVSDATLLACNDDACGLQSTVGFTAVSGQQYLIRLGTFPGEVGGVGTFTIECLGVAPCTLSGASCQGRDSSDALNSTAGVFHAADDFTPAASGAISEICWWGGYFDGFGDCSALVTDAFEVRYYSDGGGAPGALIGGPFIQGASLTVSPRFPAGGSIAGVIPEFEFSATHAPVSVTAGECYWIEIRNAISGGCAWFWELGTGGNGLAAQDGTPPDGFDGGDLLLGVDLAWCANITLGDGSVCLPPGPDNDDCANAELIACNGTAQGDNTFASTEASDPAFSCRFGAPDQGVGSIWYRFVATDTEAEASVCNSVAADTLIAIYSGTCGNLTELACGEDDCNGLRSRACATGLTIGDTYYIQVASFDAAGTGPITLDLSCPCPAGPAGDLCQDAVGPLAIPSTTAGTTDGAGIDGAAPVCGTSISAPGVWYTVVGTGTTITASLCNGNTPFDSKLSVYCGTCDNLTCVTGIDDFCGLQSEVSWCSQPGVLYYILVHGFGSASGPFELVLSEDGVSCTATVQCLPAGGCCIDGLCSILPETACLDAGGDYLGDNTSCEDVGGVTMVYDSMPNVAIPDATPAGVSDTITVPDSFTIGDVNVDLTVNHTFVGDLCVTVEHLGTTVEIIQRSGADDGSGACHSEGPFGCSEDNYNNIILDDEGIGGSIEDLCQPAMTSPPNYTPFNPLSAFDGMDSAGDWTITVSDNAGQDTGTLVSWSLHVSSPGESPCVREPCESCPPGTIPLIDGEGDFGGWCASVSHPGNVVIDVLDVDLSGDQAVLNLTKEFKEEPGFGGQIPAILIDFVQVCPDLDTVNMILINQETVVNNTGKDWLDFHWSLFDGDEAWFDAGASGGFPVAPFGSKVFRDFLDSPTNNQSKRLSAFDGVVPNGGTMSAGGTAPLKIGINLSDPERVSFTLKERPSLDGAVVAGACCLGLECQFLTPVDCMISGGNFLGNNKPCTPTACLPQNDECVDCIGVQTGVPFNGTTEGATGADITSCAVGDSIDVWHCWEADCTGTATFSLCGSGFDTTLAIFDACGGTELACNDDFCGLQSQISLSVTSGTTYFIRVSGFNGATGSYTLNVTCTTPLTPQPGGGPLRGGRVGGVQNTSAPNPQDGD